MQIKATKMFAFEMVTAKGRTFNLGVQADTQEEAVILLAEDLSDLLGQLGAEHQPQSQKPLKPKLM